MCTANSKYLWFCIMVRLVEMWSFCIKYRLQMCTQHHLLIKGKWPDFLQNVTKIYKQTNDVPTQWTLTYMHMLHVYSSCTFTTMGTSSGNGQYEPGFSCIDLESTCGLHKSKKVVVVCLSYCRGGSNSQMLKCQSLVSLSTFANLPM